MISVPRYSRMFCQVIGSIFPIKMSQRSAHCFTLCSESDNTRNRGTVLRTSCTFDVILRVINFSPYNRYNDFPTSHVRTDIAQQRLLHTHNALQERGKQHRTFSICLPQLKIDYKVELDRNIDSWEVNIVLHGGVTLWNCVTVLYCDIATPYCHSVLHRAGVPWLCIMLFHIWYCIILLPLGY